LLKTGTTILLIGILFGGLYSIVTLVSPQTVMDARVKAIPELQNPVAAGAYYDEARHTGAEALAAVIGALFILFVGFKKGQRWAWWAILCMGIFSWVYGQVRFIVIWDKKNIIGFPIGILLWLIGILLPIKTFFPKKPGATPVRQP